MDHASRALIVDDDPACRELLRRAVRRLGYEADVASAEQEAAERLRRGVYDLLVTDVCMERADSGMRLAQEVRKASPGTPVILVSGERELGTALGALRMGVLDYLPKPFTLAELEGAVERARERRSSREEMLAAYEELGKVERLRESTFAIVNHELRTPLFSAIMAAERLERNPFSETASGMLKNSLERLHGTIEEFLLHAKLSTGRAPGETEVLDYAVLVAMQVQAASITSGRAIELRTSGTPRPVRAERPELERAVGHLISNAVRFSPPGGKVEVLLDYADDAVRLAVKDEGEGIPFSEQESVFDPYYQAASHLTRRHGGLGLGLAIVRRVYEGLGGSVRVSSQPGKGSVFIAALPAR